MNSNKKFVQTHHEAYKQSVPYMLKPHVRFVISFQAASQNIKRNIFTVIIILQGQGGHGLQNHRSIVLFQFTIQDFYFSCLVQKHNASSDGHKTALCHIISYREAFCFLQRSLDGVMPHHISSRSIMILKPVIKQLYATSYLIKKHYAS